MKVSRFSCLIPIHQNIESLALFLISLTTDYTKPVLTNPYMYTPDKRKFSNLHFANKEFYAINIVNNFIINRCRQMYQLILNNRLHLFFTDKEFTNNLTNKSYSTRSYDCYLFINAYPSGAPDFTSAFRRGSCCPVICFSLFDVIVLSFGF